MPWQEQSATSSKQEFVALAAQEGVTRTGPCARFRISRPTGYAWLCRYQAEGAAGLAERSRAPATSPGRTDPEVEADAPVSVATAAEKAAAVDAKERAAEEQRLLAEERRRERASGGTAGRRRSSHRDSGVEDVVGDVASQTARSFGRSLGSSPVRGLLGGLRGRR